MSPHTAPLLDVRQLYVAFGSKTVVHGLDFAIAPGEKLALVGESGSGKTISALALLGLAGQATVRGQALFRPRSLGATAGAAGAALSDTPVDLLQLPPPALRGLRGQDIGFVFQEPMTALNPLMTIGQQISEVLELKQGLVRAQSARAAIELIASTGIEAPARRAAAYPHQLSGGQRQRAMIAMALACKPLLLLADEPTTALDVSVRRHILALLADLQRQHGMAVLLVTHDLPLVQQFADRVVVLQHGHKVEEGSVAQVFAQPQQPYTRQLLDSRPARDAWQPTPASAQQPPVLAAQQLGVDYAVPRPGWRGWLGRGRFIAVRGVDFALHPGHTLGVVGESGSGKSSLALAALGLHPHHGQLQVLGQRWGQSRAADKALRAGVQVVFQDPFSSLSPRLTVEEIVGEGLQVHAPTLNAAQRQARVRAALAEVGLEEAQFPGLLARYPHAFSGGQRQRLAIARALIVQPQLLVLDEPTSALDVTVQKQVLTLLQRLQRERGLAYLLITHDMAVVRAMAHQVLVLQQGQVVEHGPLAQVFAAPQHPYTQDLLGFAGENTTDRAKSP